MTASLVYGLLRLLPYGLPRNDAGRENGLLCAYGLTSARNDAGRERMDCFALLGLRPLVMTREEREWIASVIALRLTSQ